jgi:hypothetical protein
MNAYKSRGVSHTRETSYSRYSRDWRTWETAGLSVAENTTKTKWTATEEGTPATSEVPLPYHKFL